MTWYTRTMQLLTPEQEAVVRLIVAEVLDAQKLEVRDHDPMCGARFPLDTTGTVRCGRVPDHAGAHEFRWQS